MVSGIHSHKGDAQFFLQSLDLFQFSGLQR